MVEEFSKLVEEYEDNALTLANKTYRQAEINRLILLAVRQKLEEISGASVGKIFRGFTHNSTGKRGVFVIEEFRQFTTKCLAFCPESAHGYSIKKEDITVYMLQTVSIAGKPEAAFVFEENGRLEAVKAVDMAQRLSEIYSAVPKGE